MLVPEGIVNDLLMSGAGSNFSDLADPAKNSSRLHWRNYTHRHNIMEESSVLLLFN